MQDQLITTVHNSAADFESHYLSVREKEFRLYTDEEVAQLPGIATDHPHSGEWQVRKRSASRLIKYLQAQHRPLSILEIGCGNGWLSSRLSAIQKVQVTATDINRLELAQAKRVFGKRENICFAHAALDEIALESKTYDLILFAAAIQYFPSIQDTIGTASKLLKAGGEIHIMDSMFYPDNEREAAQKRSSTYYQSLGCTGMEQYYFHHGLADLAKFKFKLRYDPTAIGNRILHKNDPFPWIIIKHE